jgi:hypothetical protein
MSSMKKVSNVTEKSPFNKKGLYISIAILAFLLLFLGLITFVFYQYQKSIHVKAQLEAICRDTVEGLVTGNNISGDKIATVCKENIEKIWAAASSSQVEECIGLYKPNDEYLDLAFYSCLRDKGISFLDFNLDSLKP